jgi:glucosamine--fructose-6-phosphate aminotransferase (isomerizing)
MRERAITHVVIAARGTSDNAGRYAQYLLGARNGLVVGLATPSLFTVYRRPPRFHRALVLGISQSGRSPDVVAVLAEARRQGALTAALTNDVGSDLARQADVALDLCAGEEQAVAATKTYTAALAAIALLSASLAAEGEMLAALEKAPEAISLALAAEPAARDAATRLQAARYAAVLGRGFNYATAFELALKIQELTYTNCQPYSSADFLHGPLALVEPGFPVILVAAAGPLLEDLRRLQATLQEHGAEVVVISDVPGAGNGAARLEVRQVVPEWLSPLPLIVPGQLLALHLAARRGYDADAPRSIHKVTETY